MKIVVDVEKCRGMGICESIAPERFEVGDDGELVLLQQDVSDDELRSVEDAVFSCPTDALSIER